jgi:Fe-S-cluster containining protein
MSAESCDPGDRSARRRRHRALSKLYAQIPAFDCVPGCRDCCGLVPFTVAEWAAVADRSPAPTIDIPLTDQASLHLSESQAALMEKCASSSPEAVLAETGMAPDTPVGQTCLSCIFVTDAGCGIYEDRPPICRMFGAIDSPAMTCRHGRGPKRKLTEREGHELMLRFMELN